MRYPTIHRNGTSRESLIADYETAARAVQDAISAVVAIDCHGRDYYMQESVGRRDPAIEARDEHYARITALKKVYTELADILDHCVDSADNR